MMTKETMRAAVYEDKEKITVKDVPIPEISEYEILVRIKACAICGTDIRIYHYGSDTVVPPTITGHELAGTVVKVGKNVSGFGPLPECIWENFSGRVENC